MFLTSDILVGFQEGVVAARQAELLDELADATLTRDLVHVDIILATSKSARNGIDVLRRANDLARHPEVRFAEVNMIQQAYLDLVPDDTLFGDQWHHQNTGQLMGELDFDIDTTDAWNLTTGDNEVVVVICDTGVEQDHPDINQIGGVDTTSDGPGTGDPVNSHDDHGTQVAGCVSASINNELGVAGVAPDARIASARVAIQTGASSATFNAFWIADALDWAVDIEARITNHSYHTGFTHSAITAAFEASHDEGLIHFGAAGNNSESGTIQYPARLETVNSVASMSRWALRFSSNYGDDLDFCAPGMSVWTTDRTGTDGYNAGDYAANSGTSFASPVAAGVAALILSAKPTLTGEQAVEIMRLTATDIGDPGWDDLYGHGMVNALAAVELALVCPSEYNGDTEVDVLDLLDFFDDFAACENQSAPCGTIGEADFNADTVVDVADFLDFLDAFGSC